MKTSHVVACLAVVGLWFPANAAAQGNKGKVSIIPQVGVTVPIGDFASSDPDPERSGGAQAGFLIGGAVEYFITNNIAVGGAFNYNRFGFDDAGMKEGLANLVPGASLVELDAHWTIPEFGVYVKYCFMPEKPTKVFVRGGVVVASQKLTGDLKGEFPIVGSVSGKGEATVDGGVGAQGAVGVIHQLNETLGLFGEATFTNVFNDGMDVELTLPEPIGTIDPLEGEGNTQYFTFKAGVVISVGL